MTRTFVLLLALAVSIPVAAQHRGGGGGGFRAGGGMSRGGGISRGGGAGFAGGMHSVHGGAGRFYGSGFRSGYSNSWRGGYYGGAYGRGRGWGGGYGLHGWGYGWPYYYSPYVVSGFSYGWDYPYYGDYWDRSYPSYVSYPSYSYSAPQAPVVVVNQAPSYAPPVRDDYRDERPAPAPAYRTPIYKIAFQDHRIVSALAYWVKDGLLHYVTLEHEMKDVPIQSVDRRFSEQLNRDLGLTFRLPG